MDSSNNDLSLKEYLALIRKRWLLICLITLIFAGLAFFLSVTQTPVYQARTTVLLRSSSPSGLAGMSSLADLAGLNFSSSGNMGDLTSVMQSYAVAEKVLQDLNLRQRLNGWDNPKLSDRKLAGSVLSWLQKPKSKGNLIELKVEQENPQLAAEVANGFASALGYYWNKLNYTEAQRKRKYIEGQLPRVKKELEAVENKLKAFTRLGVSNPSIEMKRLEREYEIQNAVYTMLRKEYETTLLEESKEVTPFSIVDPAEVPERPFKPRVKLNTIIGALLGVFAGLFLAFFWEYWETSGS